MDTEVLYVSRTQRPEKEQQLLQAVDGAELFVLSTPLYVDALPYLVTRSAERIAAHRTATPEPSDGRVPGPGELRLPGVGAHEDRPRDLPGVRPAVGLQVDGWTGVRGRGSDRGAARSRRSAARYALCARVSTSRPKRCWPGDRWSRGGPDTARPPDRAVPTLHRARLDRLAQGGASSGYAWQAG